MCVIQNTSRVPVSQGSPRGNTRQGPRRLPVRHCCRRRRLHGRVDSGHYGQPEGRRDDARARIDVRQSAVLQLHITLVELRHRDRCVTSQRRELTNWL